MGKMIIGGGGISLEDVTGTPGDLIKGKSAYLHGSDEPQTGTLELTGNATATYVYSGKTFYSTDPKAKLTGTMTISSILSFSAAVYSSTAITFSWKNPAKGPFSGVIIQGKTGSYPTSITDGTQYYKGAGNNTSANGTSSATVSKFSGGIQYYFSIFSYCTCSAGELRSTRLFTATAKTTKGIQTFTASGTFTVPANVRSIDIFCVGGGGGGGRDNSDYSRKRTTGGGGGYTTTKKAYQVTPGQKFTVTVGNGGGYMSDGGASSFGTVLTANGGKQGWNCHGNWLNTSGAAGGSGSAYIRNGAPGTPGSNGSSGNSTTWQEYDNDDVLQTYTVSGGQGQGTTTKAFGETSGTLYSTGGKYMAAGTGSDGAANSGNGGSGGNSSGRSGGTGVVIVRWGY